jgi:hypothetical protein
LFSSITTVPLKAEQRNFREIHSYNIFLLFFTELVCINLLVKMEAQVKSK